jgi:PTH1 family peptidyl-tRNA hydrolase
MPAPGRGNYRVAWAQLGDIRIGLIKPMTYMNNSGEAVAEAMQQWGISPAELLVICDDFAIPLGTLRLRASGSDGGHNGLYSIIYQLQSDAFPRLRCGIGIEQMPRKEERADFVLSPFDAEEEPTVSEMVSRAGDVCVTFATSGIAQAMNRCTT